MIEVEIKLPVSNETELKCCLLENGFLKKKTVKEEDIYFNSEKHDFRKSDEALRVRRVINLDSGEEKTLITYKGPKLDDISMTRKELETTVGDLDTIRGILFVLGYDQEYPVRKTRQYFVRENVTACVDRVKGLGDFLELEVLVSEESEKEQALQKIEEILESLGHSMSETTRTSYLSMLMKEWEA